MCLTFMEENNKHRYKEQQGNITQLECMTVFQVIAI